MTVSGSRKRGILSHLSAKEFANFQSKKAQDDFRPIGLYHLLTHIFLEQSLYFSQIGSQISSFDIFASVWLNFGLYPLSTPGIPFINAFK